MLGKTVLLSCRSLDADQEVPRIGNGHVGLKKRLKGCLTLPTFVGMARYKNTTGMLYHLTTLGRDLRMSEMLDFEYRVEKSRMPSKKQTDSCATQWIKLNGLTFQLNSHLNCD